MEEILEKAIMNIRSGLLQNEDQVKLAVIAPILRALNWDDTNPAELVPEYSIPKPASGRVDYALYCQHGKPIVFIEAKKLGGADEIGEEQIFQYAYGQGVPLLILTDGEIWNFYLSMEKGVPAERRFYRAILTASGKTEEHMRNFQNYLSKTAVCSGDALVAAQKQHTNAQAKSEANRTIPKVWRALLEQPDPELRNLLAIAVENECGTQPELDDLDNFLENQLRLTSQHPPSIHSQPKIIDKENLTTTNKAGGKKIVGYVFNNRSYNVGAGNYTLAEILKEFHHLNPSEFMFRFAAETRGHTRRLVAQNRNDLYDKEDLIEYSVDLENGWWLGTNISGQNVRKNCKIACRIAGVTFGSELTLIER